MAASCVTQLGGDAPKTRFDPEPGRSVEVTHSSIVVSVVVLACLTTVAGGRSAQRPEGFIREGIPRMPNPPGPAPTRDLSGVWVGPIDNKPDPVPPMTPAGEALFKERPTGTPAGTRPGSLERSVHHLRSLGFPRNLLAVSSRGRFIFGSAPDRMLIT